MSTTSLTLSMSDKAVRRLRLAGYFIFALGTLFPILDYFTAIMPARLGNPQWRFGAVGLIPSYAIASLIDLLAIVAIAAFAGHRKVLLGLGTLTAVAALVFLAGAGAFVLDTLQMRSVVVAEARARFDVASVQALVRLALLAIGSAILAIAAFAAAQRAKRSSARDSSAPIVVGRSPIVTPEAEVRTARP